MSLEETFKVKIPIDVNLNVENVKKRIDIVVLELQKKFENIEISEDYLQTFLSDFNKTFYEKLEGSLNKIQKKIKQTEVFQQLLYHLKILEEVLKQEGNKGGLSGGNVIINFEDYPLRLLETSVVNQADIIKKVGTINKNLFTINKNLRLIYNKVNEIKVVGGELNWLAEGREGEGEQGIERIIDEEKLKKMNNIIREFEKMSKQLPSVGQLRALNIEIRTKMGALISTYKILRDTVDEFSDEQFNTMTEHVKDFQMIVNEFLESGLYKTLADLIDELKYIKENSKRAADEATSIRWNLQSIMETEKGLDNWLLEIQKGIYDSSKRLEKIKHNFTVFSKMVSELIDFTKQKKPKDKDIQWIGEVSRRMKSIMKEVEKFNKKSSKVDEKIKTKNENELIEAVKTQYTVILGRITKTTNEIKKAVKEGNESLRKSIYGLSGVISQRLDRYAEKYFSNFLTKEDFKV